MVWSAITFLARRSPRPVEGWYRGRRTQGAQPPTRSRAPPRRPRHRVPRAGPGRRAYLYRQSGGSPGGPRSIVPGRELPVPPRRGLHRQSRRAGWHGPDRRRLAARGRPYRPARPIGPGPALAPIAYGDCQGQGGLAGAALRGPDRPARFATIDRPPIQEWQGRVAVHRRGRQRLRPRRLVATGPPRCRRGHRQPRSAHREISIDHIVVRTLRCPGSVCVIPIRSPGPEAVEHLLELGSEGLDALNG